MITIMSSPNRDGIYETGSYSNLHHKHYAESGTPVVMIDKYHGLVLGEFERNMYDDSDFIAVIWSEEKQEPFNFEYASTRGWSYANGCVVDATPDIKRQYADYITKMKKEEAERKKELGRRIPRKGMIVRSLTTKGKAKGAQGTIVWVGESDYCPMSVKIQWNDRMVFIDTNRIEIFDDYSGDWIKSASWNRRFREWS